jgi:hypothetical protein
MGSPTPGQALINQLTVAGLSIVAHLANEFTSDPDEVVTPANITEATFPGYAPINITDWFDVNPGSADAAEVLSAVLQFIAGAITTPQEIWGFYVTIQYQSSAPQIFALDAWNEPFVFLNPGDMLQRQVRVINSLDAEPVLDNPIPA